MVTQTCPPPSPHDITHSRTELSTSTRDNKTSAKRKGSRGPSFDYFEEGHTSGFSASNPSTQCSRRSSSRRSPSPIAAHKPAVSSGLVYDSTTTKSSRDHLGDQQLQYPSTDLQLPLRVVASSESTRVENDAARDKNPAEPGPSTKKVRFHHSSSNATPQCSGSEYEPEEVSESNAISQVLAVDATAPSSPPPGAGIVLIPKRNLTLLLSGIIRISEDTKIFLATHVTVQSKGLPKKRVDFICVVPNTRLPTTVKVLNTLVSGKYVVTRRWIRDSQIRGSLQPLQPYIPFELSQTLFIDRTSIFAGKQLMFTRCAVDNYDSWSDVCSIARSAGAAEIRPLTPRDILRSGLQSDILLLGEDRKHDEDARTLSLHHGQTVFHKHFFARAIVDGKLPLDSEELRLTFTSDETDED